MLFKRLFNWIKFKTLPPSVLFKNRLFVERDSKTRRVTSNLGLTYRNSKWANYTRTDIPTNAKHSYINYCKTLFVTLLTLTIVLSYAKFYTTTVVFNDTLFFFWWLKDTTFYYLFTIFGVWTILSATFVEKFFSYFLLVKGGNSNTSSNNSKSLLDVTTSYKLGDYKHIYYNWLTNSTTGLSEAEKDLEDLFEGNQSNLSLLPQLTLLTKTFQTSSVLKRSTLSSLPDLSFTTSFSHHLTPFFSNRTLQSLELNFSSNFRTTSFTSSTRENFNTSLKFLNTSQAWNLNDVVQATENNASILSNSTGSFFTTGWDFAKYNSVWVNQPNAHILYESLENQLNSLKVSKFLYHYSYLHRNILKNSHKLTMVKKLMSSGFYDTKLVSNNMWASDVFSKLNNPGTTLNSELNLVYGNFFKNKFFNNHLLNNYSINTSINSLNLLSFYEKSYFWTLKRLHNFNSLFANNIKFSLRPFTKPAFDTNTEINSSLNNVTLAFKSDLVTTSRFLNYSLPIQNINSTPNQLPVNSTYTKDLFLVKSELALVSVDEETVLVELSNSPSSSTPIFPFFTTTNNLPASTYLQNNSFKKPTKLQSKLFTQNSTSFLNSTFLNDLRKLAILL
jgi:hypothetical protein